MLHVKKGDKVIILSGDEKGKTGKVLQIFPKQTARSWKALILCTITKAKSAKKLAA